jgi:hypothetical protein
VNRRSIESMQNFLDGLVRNTKTVMTRAELGGTLFLVALIGRGAADIPERRGQIRLGEDS